MLDPRSDAARDISTLWWWMLGIATVVFLGAVGLLILSWRRRERAGLPLLGQSERAATALVLLFGIGIPAVTLSGLFGVANIALLQRTDAPDPRSTELTIEIVGHQWFWEVRYPGTRAVTANEVHIPTGTRVNVVATSADVIHSLWVPQLNRKTDMIPGRRTRILWHTDRPGRYQGQCAEFCGLQHSHMRLSVVAQPPDRFQAWLRHQARPRARLVSAAQRRGARVFRSEACANCHTVRGTSARGTIGPDLTHLQSRRTLAALTAPNRGDELAAWVRDPQRIKPGTKMPALNLSDRELRDVLAFLERLR